MDAKKHLLRRDRIRHLPKEGWSWIDRRFVREKARDLDRDSILLYFFLAAVGDKHGLSFFSDVTIAGRLRMTEASLQRARVELERHDLIAYHEVVRGSLDMVIVQPREVFRGALLANAAALILAHNHPSGDPTPSADDLALTQRLIQAGALLALDILDHLVIGDARYTSLRELGHM